MLSLGLSRPLRAAAVGAVLVLAVSASAAGDAPSETSAAVARRSAAERLAARITSDAPWRVRARPARGSSPQSLLSEGSPSPIRAALTELSRLGLTPSAAGAATAAALAAHGLPVTALARIRAEHQGAGESTVHVAVGAADLDADGLDDVVEVEAVIAGDAVTAAGLVARAGTSGRSMWRVPISTFDAVMFPTGDISGDRRDDIVLLELFDDGSAGAEPCAPGACVGVAARAFHWTLRVITGSGATAWTTSYRGVAAGAAYVDALPLSMFDYDQAVLAANIVVDVVTGGDHDGDGREDLVVNAFDVAAAQGFHGTFIDAVGGFAAFGVVVARTEARVFRGADGSALFARYGSPTGAGYLQPAGNSVGDGTQDLLWSDLLGVGGVSGCAFVPDMVCAGAGPFRVGAEMIDGKTYATAWKAQHAPDNTDGFYVRAGDLDGDGSDDMALIEFAEQVETVAVSGRDGRVLWHTSDVFVGRLGRADGRTVVLTGAVDFAGDGLKVRLFRVNGATGKRFASTSHVIPIPSGFDVFIFIEVWSIPDADSDGVGEAITQAFTFADAVHSYLWVESGRSGAPILTRDVPDVLGILAPGDADGDGKLDFLEIGFVGHRESVQILIDTAGLDGSRSGARRYRLFATGDVFLIATSDATGWGGDDVVVSLFQFTPNEVFESSFVMIERSTGDRVWSHGDVLTTPPPVPRGSIAGRVTGEGNPFPGACVAAADAEGDDVVVVPAASDGRYVIPELHDGIYRVRFADCWFGSFTTEWYDDRPSFADAASLTIAGGAGLVGIDADLAAASAQG